MTNQTSPSARDTMVALRDALRIELAPNETYQALVAIESAIASFDRAMLKASPHMQRDPGHKRPRRQSDIAFEALEAEGTPLLVGELLHRLATSGSPVGGNDPKVNLASVLSKDDRFESIRFDGRSYWWIKGRPVPGTSSEVNDLLSGPLIQSTPSTRVERVDQA
jgi:hypothetical protein